MLTTLDGQTPQLDGRVGSPSTMTVLDQRVSKDPDNLSVQGVISATSEGTERSRLIPEFEWNGLKKMMCRSKEKR